MVDLTAAIVGGLLVAGGSTAALAAFGWRNRHEVGADWFVATMALNTAWIGVDLTRVLVEGRLAYAVLERVSTVLATCVPVAWFCFVLAYTGREHRIGRRGLAAVWTLPAAVVVAIVTSPFHRLYYAEFSFSTGPSGLVLETAPGPIGWLNLAYFLVLIAVGFWLLLRLVWDHDRVYAGQASWLLLGTLAPVALLVVALLGDVPTNVPTISLGFSVLGLAYAHGLFSHRLLDLTPASRRIGVREAFDDLGEGVVVVDVDGDVVAINDRACEMFDCRREAVIGEPLERVSSVLGGLERAETRRDVHLDGRALSVSTADVRDARDRPTGAALVVRDVTEARRREQRLEVLGRVFRHNIRNTMNAVVGPADLLADRLDGDDAAAAETVLDAGEAVVALSEDVQAVEAMMTRELRPADVAVDAFVEDVLASLPAEAPVTLESTADGVTVRTDADVLRVAFEQVLDNAIAHGTPAPDSEVVVAVEAHESGCLLHVTDDGPGIPSSELDVLRSGAETALEHASGIGLWAVHWGVARLDGAVRFADRGNGTQVSLWVPDRSTAGGAPPPSDDETAEHGGEWLGRETSVVPGDPATGSDARSDG